MVNPLDDIDNLKILIYPDPRLREVAKPVADPTDPRIARLVDKMRELMLTGDGVGLAATQVGVPLRIFLANPTRQPADELVAINPEIIETEDWQETREGCLSLPEINLKLRRHKRVKLRYQDPAGESHVVDAADFLACIFQHEGDHLDGRMIIDRASMVGRMAIREILRQLEEEYQQAAR